MSGALASAHKDLQRSFCDLENVRALFALALKKKDKTVFIYAISTIIKDSIEPHIQEKQVPILSKYSAECKFF